MSWAHRIVGYLKSLPGTVLHLVFDNYNSEPGQLYLSKGRPNKGRGRRMSSLSQQLPKLSDWNDFLTNDVNEFQLTQLLAEFMLSMETRLEKEVYVMKENQCWYRSAYMLGSVVEVQDLFFTLQRSRPTYRSSSCICYRQTQLQGIPGLHFLEASKFVFSPRKWFSLITLCKHMESWKMPTNLLT